jgi:hypothetical protein
MVAHSDPFKIGPLAAVLFSAGNPTKINVQQALIAPRR